MNYEIKGGPSFEVLEVTLQPGERIVTEAGAMAWMDPSLEVQTSTRGGLWKAIKRSVGGESFFQNTYTATARPGLIGLAPGSAGQIRSYDLAGELFLERGAYLASAPEVEVSAKWDGFKGLFSEGLFVLKASGQGPLFFNAYGALETVEVEGSYTIDSGYAVAWEPSLSWRLTRARKIRSFLFSDQLLVRFEGRGRLWIQTRSSPSFANWVHPYRRVQRKSNNDN